jgi:hypothetical protein
MAAVVVSVLAAGAAGALIAQSTVGNAATSAGSPVIARPALAHPGTAPPAGAQPGAASSAPASPGALAASAATRQQAASWVAGQAAASAIVACDPAMCAALQAAGIPAGRLLAMGTSAADPLGSDLIVATPALRSQFGAALAGTYAPAVIASFGSAGERIDIRAVAPDGAASYQAALAADRRARIAAGAQLLRNPRVAASAAARAALRAGQVDPRLLMTLAAIAADQPLRIVALGDASPGADPAAPLRSAKIAPLAARGNAALAGVRSMQSFVASQQPSFAPLGATIAPGPALSVQYAAPSPLGLLGGQ